MKTTYEVGLIKLWVLMVRLSMSIPDQTLPLGAQVLLSLAKMVDLAYRMLLEWYYRKLIVQLTTERRLIPRSRGTRDTLAQWPIK